MIGVSSASILHSQSVYPNSGCVLRGTFWNIRGGDGLLSVSGDGEDVRVGPVGARITLFSRINDRRFWETGFGMLAKVDHREDLSDEWLDVRALFPLLMGFRYPLLPLRNHGAQRPYVTAGGGPYFLLDVHERERVFTEDLNTDTATWLGLYAGCGISYRLATWFALNFDCTYHIIGLDPKNDYSGPEFGLGFGFLWGRYTPAGS